MVNTNVNNKLRELVQKNPRSWTESMLLNERLEVVDAVTKGEATLLSKDNYDFLGGEIWIYGKRHKSAAKYFNKKASTKDEFLDFIDEVANRFKVEIFHDPSEGVIQSWVDLAKTL